MTQVTQERLKEIFNYDQDGHLLWRKQLGSRTPINGRAGCFNAYGYVVIRVDKRLYQASRLIYLWHFGSLNGMEIDHQDGNPANNKIENLRLCTRSQNNSNKGLPAASTTGFKGVSYEKNRKMYEASITCHNKKKHLGYFCEPQDAALAYNKAATIYFGEFAKLNKVPINA